MILSGRPKVVITRVPSDPSVVDRIRQNADVALWQHDRAVERAWLEAETPGAQGIYSMLTDRIDAELIAQCPELNVVSNMAVGVDNIDVDACRRAGIAVGHTPGVLTDTTADTAWSLILASSRRMREGQLVVESGGWGPWSPSDLLGYDVSGSTLGIVGMGRIGEAIARRSIGFSMDVLYTARSPKPGIEAEIGAVRCQLDELLAASDHVVLAVPLSAETHHLIGATEFGRMKPTANLVNIARGPVVDTNALVAALTGGDIRCAGLDVTDPEPLPADHPLIALPNCTIIPHMGSSTWRARDAMANLAADNLLAGIAGRPLVHAVV
jgi:glyoxylate reductase